MAAKDPVLYHATVTYGPNLGVWNREERIGANTRALAAATVRVRPSGAVYTHHAYQLNEARSFNGSVPQRQCGGPGLTRVWLHRGRDVIKAVVDDPMRHSGSQGEHEDLPPHADREKKKPRAPARASRRCASSLLCDTTGKPTATHVDE
jgi:hypothetical protein